MRILALVTDGFGAGGGIARYNRDFLTALACSPSVDDVLVLPRFGAGDAICPDKVRQIPAAAGRLDWSQRALRLAAQQRPDVVFCGHLNAAPLAGGLARILRRPLWLQVHGIEAWQPRGVAIRTAAESARLVTSVSRFTRRRMLNWCAISPERVRVLPNTLSADFGPRARRADLVQRFGLDGRPVVLTVGRLSASERYKGHDRILAALPRTLDRCPTLAYLVVGSGDDRGRLETLARDAGLNRSVVFVGAVPDVDLPDIYALADVFAMPSTGEGFGIVFLEAAACGLPVIGAIGDGSADALADGVIGRLVDPDDIEGLADAIVDAVTDPRPTSPSGVMRFAFDNFRRRVDGLLTELQT